MKYKDPTLRQQLAGAYALGSLQGPARARFERLMEVDAGLRQLVVEYQEDLSPLALDAPEVRPPAHIRRRLAVATKPASKTDNQSSWWHRLGLWRGLAAANGALAVAIIAIVGFGVIQQEPSASSDLIYVGVLADPQQAPGVAVLAYNNPSRLEIEAKSPLTVAPGSELQLWFKDRESDLFEFLTVVPANEKTIPLDKETWKLLRLAKALMITREKAGNASSTPSQDVLYEGVCINLKKWADSDAEQQSTPGG